METPSRFDLDQAISSWRESLAGRPAIRTEDVDELEAHLRDSVARLNGRGLSTEESYLVAVRRLGDSTVIDAEYGKVNTAEVWRERVFWMIAGVFTLHLLQRLLPAWSGALWRLGTPIAGRHFAGAASVVVQWTLLAIELFVIYWVLRRKPLVAASVKSFLVRKPAASAVLAVVGTLAVTIVSQLGIALAYKFHPMTQQSAEYYAVVSIWQAAGSYLWDAALAVAVVVMAKKLVRSDLETA